MKIAEKCIECERKRVYCLCGNTGADQLCSTSNCTADQRLCFCYSDSTISPLLIPKISAGWYVSDLVGNPEDRLSCIAAHTYIGLPETLHW